MIVEAGMFILGQYDRGSLPSYGVNPGFPGYKAGTKCGYPKCRISVSVPTSLSQVPTPTNGSAAPREATRIKRLPIGGLARCLGDSHAER